MASLPQAATTLLSDTALFHRADYQSGTGIVYRKPQLNDIGGRYSQQHVIVCNCTSHDTTNNTLACPMALPAPMATNPQGQKLQDVMGQPHRGQQPIMVAPRKVHERRSPIRSRLTAPPHGYQTRQRQEEHMESGFQKNQDGQRSRATSTPHKAADDSEALYKVNSMWDPYMTEYQLFKEIYL